MVCMATDYHASPMRRTSPPFATTRITSRTLIAAALGVTMIMSGCTKTDEPVEKPTTPPVTATPTPSVTTDPTPTPTSEPEPILEAPDPSQVINENTAEGAKSAVEYFFALYDYTFATLDTALWKKIGADDCEFCAGVTDRVEELSAQDLVLEGGQLSITEFSFETEYESGLWGVGVEVQQEPIVIRSPDDSIETPKYDLKSSREVLLTFDTSRWVLEDIG